MQGGVINRSLIEIEIECLPGDLPEFIEIDLANLGAGRYHSSFRDRAAGQCGAGQSR
ncbi:MAG: hypothetical protein R3F44_14785 [Candidatus Competibacteraceae bacterium]